MATNTPKNTAPKAAKPAKTPEQIAADKAARGKKFVELANKRVGKALAAIANVGKLANKRAYDFDAPQCAKIETALKDETTAAMKRFQSALSGSNVAAGSGFSL